MKPTKITCDSTCDLTVELYEKYQIRPLPLIVNMGDASYRDGVDVDAEQVFEFVAKTGELPKTSAGSVGTYLDAFREYVEAGSQVVHISLSSELSSSYQNACIAAETVGDVFVVDSKSLSTGSGHLAVLAAELVSAGLSAKEIAAALEDMRERLDVSFVLQTLEYLHKGGRCSGVAAFGANMLKLRPEIQVTNGKMGVGRKYRGSAEKSILDYVRGRLEGRTDIRLDRIFITHSGVTPEILEKVKALVKELQPFDEVLETRAGCTISSHCGPSCLGVLFFRNK